MEERGGNRTTKKDVEKGARGEEEEKARFSDGSIDFDLSDFFLDSKRNDEQWARRKPWPSLKTSRVYDSTCTCVCTRDRMIVCVYIWIDRVLNENGSLMTSSVGENQDQLGARVPRSLSLDDVKRNTEPLSEGYESSSGAE